jgi:hypothetical protein
MHALHAKRCDQQQAAAANATPAASSCQPAVSAACLCIISSTHCPLA